MNFTQATDDFLMSLEAEKNYSKNTIVGYANDLKCYEDFLGAHKRSLELNDLTPSTSRRFIQDQVLNHNAKPRTLQRRISCLKSLSCWLRRQELVDLTWEQVNLDNQTIRVFGKGKKERLLPMHMIVVPLFHQYKEHLAEHQLKAIFLNILTFIIQLQ